MGNRTSSPTPYLGLCNQIENFIFFSIPYEVAVVYIELILVGKKKKSFSVSAHMTKL